MDAIEGAALVSENEKLTEDELIKSTNSQLVNHGLLDGCLYNTYNMYWEAGLRTTAFTEFLAYAPLPTHEPPFLAEYNQDVRKKQLNDYLTRKILNNKTIPDIKIHYMDFTNSKINCASFSHDAKILAIGIKHTVLILKIKEFISSKEEININSVQKKRKIENFWKKEVLIGHTGNVQKIIFAPFDDYCVSTGDDLTIRLWSLESCKCVRTFRGHIGPVFQICFAPHYTFLASAGYDKTIKIWSINKSDKPLHILKYHVSDVNDIDIHPNSNYVVSASNDGLVIVWKVIDGKKMRIFKGHKLAVLQVKFSACGRFLVSSGVDHKTLIWDLQEAVLVAILDAQDADIISTLITHDNEQLILVSNDHVGFWNFSDIIKQYKNEKLPMFSRNYDLKEKYEHWNQWQHKYSLGYWERNSVTVISGTVTYRNLFHIACVTLIKSTV